MVKKRKSYDNDRNESSHFKDMNCEHNDDIGVYDSIMNKDQTEFISYRMVCEDCGLIGKWVDVDENGEWDEKAGF